VTAPRRYPSRPDREPREPHAPDVYEILEGFDERIGGLEADSKDNKRDNASILTKLTNIEATDRHATTKLIAGLATTAILTIGGILGGQQLTKAAPPVEHPMRSPLDMRFDECRPIHEAASRTECFDRVFAESPK
jgi:hypothetical protein